MSRDKTSTHKKVMAAAREEFMASGYEKASMRSIAGRCGMTAAGLYRHCRDKEDLFDQLAAPAVQRIEKWQEDHLDRYKTAVQKGNVSWQDSWVDMMRDVVYPHMEDYHLLLAKAQGSKYGNYLHEMTEKSEGQFWAYLSCLRSQGCPAREISRRELHLLLTAYTAALFEPVIHGYSEEDARTCLETVEAFFLPGWKNLIGL